MCHARIYLRFWAACLIVFVSVAASADPDRVREVFEHLRQRDQRLWSGIFLTGTVIDKSLLRGSPERTRFELTLNSDSLAWLEKVSLSALTENSDKDMWDRREYMLYEVSSKVNARLTIHETDSGQVAYLDLYPPRVPHFRWKASSSLLCTGRGFSGVLSRPLSVETLPNGMLLLRAAGYSGDQDHPLPVLQYEGGEWLLTIDPSADYLVREAIFVDEGGTQREIIRTEGFRQSLPLPIAERGTLTIQTRMNRLTERTVTFDALRFSFSEMLMQTVFYVIMNPPHKTNVSDWRPTNMDGCLTYVYLEPDKPE